MISLGLTFLVYAGISGPTSSAVEAQIGAVLHKEVAIETVTLTADQRRVLARHQPAAAALVQHFHTDGLVVGEIEIEKHRALVRIVVYDGDGRRKDLVEVPLDGDTLDEGGIAMLEGNIVPDLIALQHGAPVAGHAAPGDTDETPNGPVTPVEPAAPVVAEPDESPRTLHARLAVGLGIVSRSFNAAPDAVRDYSSSPVPAFRLVAEVEPLPTMILRGEAERSLGMSTSFPDGKAPTLVERWQLSGAWGFKVGAHGALLPQLGIGRRTFTIDTDQTDRSPDADYTYLSLGAGAVWRTNGWALSGWLAYQPVIGGDQPTEAAFGHASRWAIDARVTLDVPVNAWFFVRAEGYLQRFSWSFAMPDPDSGADSASDMYLGLTLFLGAQY